MGKIPMEEFLSEIKDKTIQARIKQRVARLLLGNYGDYKRLTDTIYELRLHFGAGYRIYFAEHEASIIVLLAGGDKSTQTKDIGKAKLFWEDFLERYHDN
jgi:putative addiction module killer protein